MFCLDSPKERIVVHRQPILSHISPSLIHKVKFFNIMVHFLVNFNHSKGRAKKDNHSSGIFRKGAPLFVQAEPLLGKIKLEPIDFNIRDTKVLQDIKFTFILRLKAGNKAITKHATVELFCYLVITSRMAGFASIWTKQKLRKEKLGLSCAKLRPA